LDAIAVLVAWTYNETDMERIRTSSKKIVAAMYVAVELTDCASISGARREHSDVTGGT